MSATDFSASTGVPADHPARVLLIDDDQYEHPYLDVKLTSGHRPDGLRALRYWLATAEVGDHSDADTLHIPVAHMSVTVVNEFLGDPVMELDALDTDSLIVGEALWSGNERTPEFEDITAGDWGPVAVVNSYEVNRDWRGTALTPITALRMLEVFAHLDLSAAALFAAPYNSDLPDRERDAASVKIAAMWQRAGFVRLYPDATDERSKVMVRTLDASQIAKDLDVLAGTDPLLQTVIEE